MRIVHVITRLIIGGAQENTLLTVEGLHHRHGDDVTLITGPAEGPGGPLREGVPPGAEGRGHARADPGDPPRDRLSSVSEAEGVDSKVTARGRAYAQLEGGYPRPCRGLG